MDASAIYRKLKQMIADLGPDRTRGDMLGLKRSLSGAELAAFSKIWNRANVQGRRADQVARLVSAGWTPMTWHPGPARGAPPTAFELQLPIDGFCPYEWEGSDGRERPIFAAGSDECMLSALVLAGWRGAPSLRSIGAPDIRNVVGASQGCEVQYFSKRGKKVIGVDDALNATAGTFIITGLWDGKKKCADASCWSIYSFYSRTSPPPPSPHPSTHRPGWPRGRLFGTAPAMGGPRRRLRPARRADRAVRVELSSGCPFQSGVLPRRFPRCRSPRVAQEHARRGLHLLALRLQGVRDRGDHGRPPGTDVWLAAP